MLSQRALFIRKAVRRGRFLERRRFQVGGIHSGKALHLYQRAVRKTAILTRGAVVEGTILIQKAVVKWMASILRTVIKRMVLIRRAVVG